MKKRFVFLFVIAVFISFFASSAIFAQSPAWAPEPGTMAYLEWLLTPQGHSYFSGNESPSGWGSIGSPSGFGESPSGWNESPSGFVPNTMQFLIDYGYANAPSGSNESGSGFVSNESGSGWSEGW